MIFCNFINILSLMSIINSFYFWSSTFNLLKIVVHHLETLDKQFNNRFFKDFIFLSNFSNQIIQKTLLNSKLSLKIWKIQLGILSKRRKIYESKLMESKFKNEINYTCYFRQIGNQYIKQVLFNDKMQSHVQFDKKKNQLNHLALI